HERPPHRPPSLPISPTGREGCGESCESWEWGHATRRNRWIQGVSLLLANRGPALKPRDYAAYCNSIPSLESISRKKESGALVQPCFRPKGQGRDGQALAGGAERGAPRPATDLDDAAGGPVPAGISRAQ